MLKKLLLASAASVLMMGAAQAADVEAPPAVYDWTGGYIGIQGGYAWGKTDAETDIDPEFTAIDSLDVDDFKANGFLGGAHVGYLLQSDSFVYGVEADIEYADLNDEVDIVFDGGGDGGTGEKDIDWLGSLRLRAGIAADRALFYATGGLAVGGVSLETDLSEDALDAGLTNDDYDKTKWGWTLGAGVEYAVTDALSARIEYRYTDLGKSDVRVETEDGFGVDGETDNDFHAVRAGLSWHFNQ
ncbi:outer membrane protein [Aestuariivirga sp. YIM B02566]|uniref:Porin family protein n=1 Tax=Taklimakanibacter albus TaxID=2800327 RepID=A0ACC5QXK7_9HYPH|nr:outer membrane protein [Aestuariivirga sp. YIM B02566]MBK1865098.1 porin family protein [Aestuariivirga sp. YIM B02566]